MTPEQIVATILPKLSSLPKGRQLVAVAGPPASGKSTLAEALAAAISGAAYVPMDGFHLDNAILDARGLRPRKGAPQTFDADGFVTMIRRLRAGEDVIAPIFNRHQDQSIAGALHIPPETGTVIVEGNYLLYDAAPWRDLGPLWDFTIRLDVPLETLETRLIQRWRDHGFSQTDARAKALQNDIPNATAIVSHALPADLTIS